MDRQKTIIRASIVGIFVNLFLVVIKVIAGMASHSIAIVLDAVNSASDALSQMITIAGTKLSGKAPDKKHPFGYGRIEYLTAVVTALIVLTAGVTSAKESVLKILHPQDSTYGMLAIVIMIVSIVAKLLYGNVMKLVGKSVKSTSLTAMGTDAYMDSILTAVTLVAAAIRHYMGYSVEGLVGALISVFIIKAGFEMIMETLNSLIGEREDGAYTKELKAFICGFENVHGAYDLILHNYGPNESIGSVHIEVDDELEAYRIHRLTREIDAAVYAKYNIIITIGIYASNNSDETSVAMKETLAKITQAYPNVMQTHGFYMNRKLMLVMFDLVLSFDEKEPVALRNEIARQMKEAYPDYTFDIVLDSDYSD